MFGLSHLHAPLPVKQHSTLCHLEQLYQWVESRNVAAELAEDVPLI